MNTDSSRGYPERELKITAELFGSLIKHQLVSSLRLGIALRCVLDALQKPRGSKMVFFGLTALEKYLDRLGEWPLYCDHILKISHMREEHPTLVDSIERALARVAAGQQNQQLMGHLLMNSLKLPEGNSSPWPAIKLLSHQSHCRHVRANVRPTSVAV